MTRDKLDKLLNEQGVPRGAYSLSRIQNGECLCLLEVDRKFKIIYNSRGDIDELGTYEEENSACIAFLDRLRKDYPHLK